MAKPMRKSLIMRDPIHGSIELDGELVTIIDTPQFQRLRRIKQLGGASFVYPGAVHSRFEHSIGVCHIAGELMKALYEQHSKDKIDHHKLISQEDVLCVQIAALCHDLGHGPFSHLYDKLIENNDDNVDLRKHEHRSAKILENILQESEFWKIQHQQQAEDCLPKGRIRALSIEDKDLEFIQRMITFSVRFEKATAEVPKQEKDETEKDFNKRFYPVVKKFIEGQLADLADMGRNERVFLLEIVANGLTGIDVDKMDYFARDSHGLGLPNRFDWRRYIQVAMVKQVKNDSTPECYRLCTLDKEEVNLYELFHTRAVLHQIAYQHKTTRAVEYLLRNALKESCVEVYVRKKLEGGKIKKENKSILECWKDMDAFHLLDDTLVDIILKTGGKPQTDPGASCIQLLDQEKHSKVRDELSRVIDTRRLPKFVGVMDDSHTKFSSALSYCKDGCLFSEKIKINYGMKDQDPLKLHVFYSKHGEVDTPRKVPFVLVPKQFEEIRYFWYYDTHKHGDGADECLEKLRSWARNTFHRNMLAGSV